jgi:RNA polymerase sigma-70 factor (ECF subfamily)
VNLLALSATMRDARQRLLLELARRGSEEAFRRLYVELYEPVSRFVGARVRGAAEVEDLVATVFGRFVEGLESFDAGRGSVTVWVLGMARHAVIDHQRRRLAFGGVRQAAASIDDLHEVLAAELPDPLGTLIRDEEIRAVRAWVRRQDEATRELLDLKFGQGLNSREIAQVMGLTQDAVKKRCERVLRQMRQELPTESTEKGRGGAPCMNVD